MVERPKFSEALEVRNRDGQTTGLRPRAGSIWRSMADMIGALVPARRKKTPPPQSDADTDEQDPREASDWTPGLVTVMSLIAIAYVIVALSGSPRAIGVDAVAPRETVAVAPEPASPPELSAAVQPDPSAAPPTALVAPEGEASAAVVGSGSAPLSSAVVPAQPAALPDPGAQPADRPVAAVAQSAAQPGPDLAQPAVPAGTPSAPAVPPVELAAAALPAPVPLPSAVAAPGPGPAAPAEAAPGSPLPAEVVAAPVVAQPAPTPASEPAAADAPPVVAATDPARLAAPAMPTEAAAPPAAIAQAASGDMSPPGLPEVAEDTAAVAVAMPFVPVVPGIDLSLPGPAPSETVERASLNGPRPMAAAPSLLAAIRDDALASPIAPDSIVNVALAPPAPLRGSADGEQDINPAGTFDGVFVRVAVPGTVPDGEVEQLVGVLQDVGLGDGRFTRVNFTVTETHIRYYLPGDAEAARALAEIIGAEARDHTNFRPSPPDGTLELFIAGGSSAPQPRAAAPQRAATPQRAQARAPEDDMTRMRNNILNRLRSGGDF